MKSCHLQDKMDGSRDHDEVEGEHEGTGTFRNV